MMANDAASPAAPGELTLRARHHYPENFTPVGISYAGLSRINADVQLDLGFVNMQKTVDEVNRAGGSGERGVDVHIAFSAYLTPGAFIKLYEDVNHFYDLLRSQGMLPQLPESA